MEQPQQHTVIEIITSTECIAAFVGALAAFALAAIAQRRTDKRAQWMAGNEAIFALAQMSSVVIGLNRQQFDDQIGYSKEVRGREPNYTEFWPVEAGTGDVLRPRLDALGFLLQSHNPDLLNRLAVVVQTFDVMMKVMDQLHLAQNQFQQALATQLPNLPGTVTLTALEDLLSPYLMARLKALVEGAQAGLPDCAKELQEIGKQLSEAMSYSFPARKTASFELIERERPTQVPTSAGKPRLWRRVVRVLSRLGRKKVF